MNIKFVICSRVIDKNKRISNVRSPMHIKNYLHVSFWERGLVLFLEPSIHSRKPI